MSKKHHTRTALQEGPGLWDALVGADLPGLPVVEDERYLFFDPGRGIKIPRVQYYLRANEFADPAQFRGRALRSQSTLLVLSGITVHPYALAFVLYSGGNDSSVAAHFTTRVLNKEAPSLPLTNESLPYWVLHLDTGIGIDENFAHVQSTARTYGYPLEVYKTDVRYEDLVLSYGFPGGPAHNFLYAMLKKRPLQRAIAAHTYSGKKHIAWIIDALKAYCRLLGVREAAIDAFIRDRELTQKEVVGLYENILAHYPGNFYQQFLLLEAFKREAAFFESEQEKKILLISGVRSKESRRRMGIMRPLTQEGRLIWLAPFIDWDGNDVLNYLQSAGLPINPVEPKLHRSSDCNCGSFAVPGEREELVFWFPEMGQRIAALEERAHAAGFHWGWGSGGPPPGYRLHKKGQQYLPGLEPAGQGKAYMCSSCEIRQQIIESQQQPRRPELPGGGT
jgi:3'-phosphoadenosine 5'-phosphosulfate sulfotransferase (PAPS reductase)/FAD synthetase